jgi:dUTP pyrophosphatase
MKLKIKKLTPNAVIPTYSRKGDAALDLVATSIKLSDLYIEYGTSLAVAIPEGYVGLLFPRSSISNFGLALANSVGVIDSNYRGELKLRYYKHRQNGIPLVGERVGQLMIVPIPSVELIETDHLDDTERGSLGFGSSGK